MPAIREEAKGAWEQDWQAETRVCEGKAAPRSGGFLPRAREQWEALFVDHLCEGPEGQGLLVARALKKPQEQNPCLPG